MTTNIDLPSNTIELSGIIGAWLRHQGCPIFSRLQLRLGILADNHGNLTHMYIKDPCAQVIYNYKAFHKSSSPCKRLTFILIV